MTVKIALPPDEGKKLTERAAASGQNVDEYVRRLIKRDIDQPGFAELFAPVHQAASDSGMQEKEIDALIDQAVADSRSQRRAKHAS